MNGKFYNTGRWTEQEHALFMQGIKLYGKDWKKVQQLVGTRTSAQSRSHAQKVLPKVAEGGKNSKNPVAHHPPSKNDKRDLVCNEPMVEKPSEDGISADISPKKDPKVTAKRKFSEMEVDECKDPGISAHHDLTYAQRSHKRKCTIDVSSMNDVSDLLIEDDEVSLKLLRKLTTPQKPMKHQSFCYPMNGFEGFKLEFNSDIDSVGGDDLGFGEEVFGNINKEKF